ncbi:MAG: Lrp/AsnC ligand binding domain-containing protein [Victivallaceae bacterium]|nr:Lrp/AsnC ligand binding domain-containing protein [Victivallaceae bacterium]
MVTGIVLINAERSRLDSVVESLMNIDGITEVYTVAGEYDLVAMIRVQDNKQLADIVARHMTRNVDGIKYTKTLISLEANTKVDLCGVFG